MAKKKTAKKKDIKKGGAKGKKKAPSKKKTAKSDYNKQISNPSSTGDVGGNFETEVATCFVTLMLSGGFAPTFLAPCVIKEISFQKRGLGYGTDDLIVLVETPGRMKSAKLLCQVKRAINIGNNKVFKEVIHAAWRDFNNPDLFTKGHDTIALITGSLSKTDITNTREIFEWARHRQSAQEFFTEIRLANYSSKGKRNKLKIFKELVNNANGGVNVPDQTLWEFIKSFHLLGYDLDIRSGVTLSLLQSLIDQHSSGNAHSLWTDICYEVNSYKQNGGTITCDALPEAIRSAFQEPGLETIPADLGIRPSAPAPINWDNASLAIVNLLGGWDENA